MAPTTRPARLPAAATAAVLLLVALIAAARPAAACRVVNVDVSLAASASNATKDAYNTVSASSAMRLPSADTCCL
jgi:hypothetical protein